MGKTFAFCLIAGMLSSCSEQTNGVVGDTPQQIQFVAVPCEYARQAFIRAFQEYEKHQGNGVLRERQEQSRLAMESVCDSTEEKLKVWACAEGHSCR